MRNSWRGVLGRGEPPPCAPLPERLLWLPVGILPPWRLPMPPAGHLHSLGLLPFCIVAVPRWVLLVWAQAILESRISAQGCENRVGSSPCPDPGSLPSLLEAPLQGWVSMVVLVVPGAPLSPAPRGAAEFSTPCAWWGVQPAHSEPWLALFVTLGWGPAGHATSRRREGHSAVLLLRSGFPWWHRDTPSTHAQAPSASGTLLCSSNGSCGSCWLCPALLPKSRTHSAAGGEGKPARRKMSCSCICTGSAFPKNGGLIVQK